VWDIESTNLNATFGDILCIGWKFLGQPKPTIYGWGARDFNDKRLVASFIDVFAECDYHVTWYGGRFDLPMVKTKAIEHGLPPLPPKPHIDLWRFARSHFKSHSNRLDAWSQLLDTTEHKTAIAFNAWKRAMRGDRGALETVKAHCEKDVLVLEEVFHHMRPWLDNEPARGLVTGDHKVCPSCGSEKVWAREIKLTLAGVYRLYRCQNCGKYMRGRCAVDRSELRNTI
jgi:uncharacterized protein YprB with RNaseH-like and TPR domain/predicted RNA-binding Zn-ribbon protein involved in translation (DUF1610 family)